MYGCGLIFVARETRQLFFGGLVLLLFDENEAHQISSIVLPFHNPMTSA
jgi:hypothetical protein